MCEGPAAPTYLLAQHPGHPFHLRLCSRVGRSVLVKAAPHQPGTCQCHLGRCQASCHGNPGSALDGNTRPLSASSERPCLPSSLPLALNQLSSKRLSKGAVAAETPGGREGVGERLGGKTQCSVDVCCSVGGEHSTHCPKKRALMHQTWLWGTWVA